MWPTFLRAKAARLLLSARLSRRNSVRPSVRSSHGWNEIGPSLLLITYRKSYSGSQLEPNSMTLNDLERQNSEFYGFFGDLGLQHKSMSFTRCRHATIVMRFR